MKHLSLIFCASLLAASVVTQAQAQEARTGGKDYPSLEEAIQAAEDNATVTMLQNVDGITFSKCITLDMNGHTANAIWVQNQQGTVTIKNGHIYDKVDGQDGDYTAFVGKLVLENLKVDQDVWVDGHYCYIKSGIYNSVNNHRCDTHYGTAYISGNNTFVGDFNEGGWNYDGGEIILLGGIYTSDPSSTWGRVWVDKTRSVRVLNRAPEGAPASNYVWQVYDDGTEASGVISFTESEPNNEWYEADEIAPNCIVSAELANSEEADTQDWFKVILPEEGDLSYTLTADKSLRIEWYTLYAMGPDGTLHQIQKQLTDHYNTGDVKTGTRTGLKAGTYYIKLNRWDGHGSYTLETKFTPCAKGCDNEPNDEDYLAQEIKLSKMYEGRLGYEYYDDCDKVDWYKVEIPEEGDLSYYLQADETLRIDWYTLYAMGPDGTLHQIQNQLTDHYNTGDTKTGTRTGLKAGTYYIKLNHWAGYGGYLLEMTFTACATACDNEPNDEDYLAQEIEFGKSYQGRLGYEYYEDCDKVDWYKVEIPEEGDLSYNLQADETLRIEWYTLYAMGPDGTLHQIQKQLTDHYNTGDTKTGTRTGLKAGTYYIKLNHWNGYGGYKLKMTFTACRYTADSEPNDEDYLAQEIELGKAYQGRLGYEYYEDCDKVDWYRFELNEASKLTYTVHAEETLRIDWITIYLQEDGSLKQVKNDFIDHYNSGEAKTGTIDQVLNPGTYYVKLHHWYGHGGYHFGIQKGTESAIEAISTDADSTLRFDIYGRTVSSDAKGFILQRGQKTVVR